MPDEPDKPKPEKPAKTRRQRVAAAGHFRKHRDAQKAAGVPTGRQIDTAFAAFLLQAISRERDLSLNPSHLPELQTRVIRRAGWDGMNSAVTDAVTARVLHLLNAKSPSP